VILLDRKELKIHEVEKVIYLHDERQVNSYLQNGWFLLSTGFLTNDTFSEPLCILGSLIKEDPKTAED
jgi:hypothetical protein